MKISLLSAVILSLCAAGFAADQEDLPAQIKALQKERIDVLTKLVTMLDDGYHVGTIDLETLIGAETALLDARLSAADTPASRILLLKEAVERETKHLKIVEVRFAAKEDTEVDVARVRAHLLDTTIRLLREQMAATPRG